MSLSVIILSGIAAFSIYRIFKFLDYDRPYFKAAEQHGCKMPTRLKNHRPLGVDRVEEMIRADLDSRLMQTFTGFVRSLGTTFEHCFLGARAFGTIDPRNLEAILNSKFEDWSMGPRRKVMFPLFGDGIFTQDGPAWKHSRDLLRPQFAHRQYEDLEVIRESMDVLLETLPAFGVVDLQPYFFRLTLDVTTAFLFGESVGSLKSEITSTEANFGNAFNTAQDYIAKRLRLQDLYFLIGGRKFYGACDLVHKFADKVIDKNLARDTSKDERENKYVFLDNLARGTPDRTALRSQIINILVAGRDTTACCITWTIFHLVRHPRILEKLKTDISTSLQGRTNFNRNDLKNMQYLQDVIKETLRLYPSIPVNTRTAVRDTILPIGGGTDGQSPVFVPKGVVVGYSAYAMHRRPDFYGMDADSYRPERWSEDLGLYNDPVNAKYGYLPFNGGPRLCLGRDFGTMEAAYAVVRLLQKYPNIKLPPGEKLECVGVEKQTMTLVVSSTNGCKVQLA